MHQPRIFHLLQRAHGALFRAADRKLRSDAGISSSQQGVLFVLHQKDGRPIGEIAKVLSMSKSTLTSIVDRLVEDGLARRETSFDDGRNQLVYIEDKGRALIERAAIQTRAVNAALLEGFTTTEIAAVERFLTHVSENGDRIVSGISHPNSADQTETHHD
ncbi:MarR family winged helix-turn-helix transcriptional regulator [Henriciella sp. AS95]|uniref:MarR family winged helix-turn-helix transcriptional regulator n=1 Tax=Henriciella sp. AS95 TaxID=3135782 RepID=UPI00316D1D1B